MKIYYRVMDGGKIVRLETLNQQEALYFANQLRQEANKDIMVSIILNEKNNATALDDQF